MVRCCKSNRKIVKRIKKRKKERFGGLHNAFEEISAIMTLTDEAEGLARVVRMNRAHLQVEPIINGRVNLPKPKGHSVKLTFHNLHTLSLLFPALDD